MLRNLTIALAAVFLLVAPACSKHAEDEKQIKQVFANFAEYNNTSNGAGMLNVMSKNTFELYGKLLALGLDGTEAQVRALDGHEKTEVLRMRAMSSRADLAKLDGRGYVQYATSQGWYVLDPADRTKDTLRGFAFTSDDEATAKLYEDGEDADMKLRFVKEDGVWKFDETSMYTALAPRFLMMAKEEGMSVNELVVEFLEMELERELPKDIWQPMK